MQFVKENGLHFYQFDHLADCEGLGHAVFTRHGGASAKPFDSLNVAYGLGDEPGSVRYNRRRILQTVGGDGMAFLRQVHGDRVIVAKNGQQVNAQDEDPPEADAFITSKPGLVLAIQVADCQPILLYDPNRQVIANVHAGWRGSLANIAGRTVAAMATGFRCRPTDILAGIGPSLGSCCAEFNNYRTEIPNAFWSYKDDRNHFDFWAITVDQLCAAGLLPDNIEVSRICTRCVAEHFFSYRAEKKTGRFAAVIGLNLENNKQAGTL